MKKLRESEYFPYKILGIIMIVCSIFMFIFSVLIYNPTDIKQLLDYAYAKEEAKRISLFIACFAIPLFLYGFIISIFKIRHKAIAYIGILFSIVCVVLVNVASQFDFVIIFLLPAFASLLFIDMRLTGTVEIFSVIGFLISFFISAFVLEIYPIRDGSANRFALDCCKLVFPNLAILVVFSLLFNILSKKTTFLKETNIEQIKNMDNRTDVMNILINSSFGLFTTTNLKELEQQIVNTCKDVTGPFIENPDEEITIYLGGSENGVYSCKRETGEAITAVKTQYTLDVVLSQEKEINIPLEYQIDDIKDEFNEFGELILSDKVEKERVRIEREKVKFNYTFEREKGTTLITIYSKDSKTRKLRLIYYVIIEARIIMNETVEEIISILANNIGVALINLNLNLEFLASQKEMIYSFSIVTDSRSHHTANHVKRVSEYMKILCSDKKWGFSDKKIERISIASMMHDVGKIYIPTEILDKNSGLTESEYEMIKTHVTKGAELVEKCPGDIMRYATVMIRDHHERWDGKGYLKKPGPQIDLLARIIAIADVFDALMSPRPYKESWPKNKVRDTIVHDTGHFDPDVIAVFMNHFDELVEIYEKYKDEKIE